MKDRGCKADRNASLEYQHPPNHENPPTLQAKEQKTKDQSKALRHVDIMMT